MHLVSRPRIPPLKACTSHAQACTSMCKPARGYGRVHVILQASTRDMHAGTPFCMPARGTCTRARHSACQHEAHARLHVDLHASTRHMDACTSICMAAQGTCTPAARRAGLHALESLMFGVTC